MGELEENLKTLITQAKERGEESKATQYADMLESVKISGERLEHIETEILSRISRVSKSSEGQQAEYSFHFVDEKEIVLTADDLVTPRAFISAYIAVYDARPGIAEKNWPRFINQTLAKIDLRRIAFSEENMTLEIILNGVRRLRFIKEIGDENLNDWGIALYNEQDRVIEVRSETIRRILEAEKIKITLRKLHELLNSHLAGASKRKRIGKFTYHFWQFKTETLGITENEAIGEEHDGNSEDTRPAGNG